MKRVFAIILVSIMTLTLTTCAVKKETIEGYWMAEDGETISFDAKGKSITGGVSMNYSVYDKNNLSLTCLGISKEYRFNIKDGVLSLRSLSDNSLKRFYKDEGKQEEIQKRLFAQKKLEEKKAQKETEERMQRETEERIQKEHEEKMELLNERINEIDGEVERNTKCITYQEECIAQKVKYIQDEEKSLGEVESELVNLQCSSNYYDDFMQNKVAIVKDKIKMHNQKIDEFNNQIKNHEENITEFRKNIAKLQEEKGMLTDELEGLGKEFELNDTIAKE